MFKRFFSKQSTRLTDLTRPVSALAVHQQALQTVEAFLVHTTKRTYGIKDLSLVVSLPDPSAFAVVKRLQTWLVLQENNRTINPDTLHYVSYQLTLDDLTITNEDAYVELHTLLQQLAKAVKHWLEHSTQDTTETHGRASHNRRLTANYAWELTQFFHRLLTH